MIKRHAQLVLKTRAQKRAMSTAASLVPQNSVCDLGQEVAWTGASKSTSSTIIEVPCYMMTVDSDSGASDTEEIPALPPPPPPPPPRLSAGMDEEEEKRKRREKHKKEEQERRERLRRDDEEWGASVSNRPSRLSRGRGYGFAVPQVPQASTPLTGTDRERSRHRPRPLSSPSSDGGPQLPPQPMYAPLPDIGVSPMLRESSGPPPPAAEPVSTASPPPTPYCFRSMTAASLDSSAPSSVKPYDSPLDWTPAQRDRKILAHVREVVRRLRLDLGFLATVLRIHFGVEYLQEEDPHPCLNPNIPYGKPSFAPERRPWSSVSENHFTDYAKDLCIKMREAAGLSTPAGKIATMIVAVITGYVGLRDTLSEGAWVPPPTDLGPYMTCMIERVLSYMLYCRMMTRYEHVLTPTVMFKYAPSGYGEPPYDQFHAKAPFERGNVYLLLGFPNAQAFRNHYDVAHQLPQGYPEGGGFVLPGLIPPPSVPPPASAPEGSSEEVEEEMDTEDQDVSPTAVEREPLPLAPAQPPSEWTNTAALTLFALQEAALDEAERVNKAALPPISVSEEQALMSLTQASLTAQALPLTTRDPPGTNPIQIVVPFYEEFGRAGYLYGHYRESQLNDRQIPVRTTTGVISRTNSRRTDPGYLAMDRDETNWPYLFHPTVQAAVRRALETMCPPLAAELLCLPSTASREVYRQYGMNPAVFVQQGPITLEHIYRGNNTTDDELIPHALGTDIIGDLVHMGACRGAYRHLQNLKCPNEWAWEQDLCSFVFSPQHAVTKVLAWCRYSIALAVYGVDNFTRTVGDSETQQCPELCYPPAPTQYEVQVFHIWARKMMAANPVDYPEYAGHGPPAWTDADTSNWSFRLACNAIPTIDSVWEAWFTSPRQQFFMANLINITPEDAPAWVNQGCFPLEPNEVWGTSLYRRDTASLNRLLPQMMLRPPGLPASSVTDDYESIFRSALRIVRQRDYVDFAEGGKLSSTPLAAPTWPLSRAVLRSVVARIRQPYDPDVLMLDGGFYDATQPEIVPDPLIPLSSTELQTLLVESKLYRTAASYCTTMGNWRDILFQCKMFLAGHYQGYDSGELQTWMDNVLDLRRREPIIPRVVETTKLVETILLALYKSGCVSHYPRWRALHFGVREHCQDDTKCCALCWREIPEGGARYQSAGECSHQFHMTCILALVELDPEGEPHCPVCQRKTQIAEPERYKQFQLFPVRDPELRTLDGKVLPTITAPPVLLLMVRGPLGPSSLSGSGTHSRPLSRAPSRAPSITDTDNQDVLDLGARDTPFSEHDEAMEVVETPPALLEEQRRQSLEALPGNLAQDYPDVARYLERPNLDDLLLPKLREKMINLLGKTTAQEPIDFYKLLATIPTGPTDRGPTRDHQWTLALSDAIHARIERNEWYHRPDMERWPFWRNLITIYRSEEEKIRQGAAGRVVRDGIYAFLRAVLYYVSPYHMWMLFRSAASHSLIDLWAAIERVLMTARKDSRPPEYGYFDHRTVQDLATHFQQRNLRELYAEERIRIFSAIKNTRPKIPWPDLPLPIDRRGAGPRDVPPLEDQELEWAAQWYTMDCAVLHIPGFEGALQLPDGKVLYRGVVVDGPPLPVSASPTTSSKKKKKKKKKQPDSAPSLVSSTPKSTSEFREPLPPPARRHPGQSQPLYGQTPRPRGTGRGDSSAATPRLASVVVRPPPGRHPVRDSSSFEDLQRSSGSGTWRRLSSQKDPRPQDEPPPSARIGQSLHVGQVGYDNQTHRDVVINTDCIRTAGPTELPPPPRAPQGLARTIDRTLPLTHFKYRDLPQQEFADGIASHPKSLLLPRRLRYGTMRPFTYGGNTFWSIGRTSQVKRVNSVSAGPRHRIYSQERENYQMSHMYVHHTLRDRRTRGRQELYKAIRDREINSRDFGNFVRSCHNPTIVCRHLWPNTNYGRLAQARRHTDVTTAWEYEQQSRNPSADVCMRMEALDNRDALQHYDRDHSYTLVRMTGPVEHPRRAEIPYQSRDRDPEETVERAVSIASLTYNIHPSLPPPPLFARTPAQARFMFSQLRTVPVPGGDRTACPVLAAFDMEAVTGSKGMCFSDGTRIRPQNMKDWRRRNQDYPVEEFSVPGLKQGPRATATRASHTTPLRPHSPRPTAEPFSYLLWRDEYKHRLGYIPNVQTVASVPYVIVIFVHHLPVYVIPLVHLFEPDTLFAARNDKGEYYQKTKKPKEFTVDCARTPSVPSPWFREEMTGLAARNHGHVGQIWLVMDAISEIKHFTTAFQDMTFTRTTYGGSPDDRLGRDPNPACGYPGRPLTPGQTFYVPIIAVEQCLAAAGDLKFFEVAPEIKDEVKDNSLNAFGVVTLLLWAHGTRHLSTPGLEWIIHQQIGDNRGKIMERLNRRRHSDPSVLVNYMRGPPESAPPIDPRLSVGEVSEQVRYQYHSRYRELFLRTTSPDVWTAPDCLTEYLIGDVVSTYWGFIVFAIKRSFTPEREPKIARGAFGRLVNPILSCIRQDCDTPIAFRQLRDLLETPQDTPNHQRRRLDYGIHDVNVRGVLLRVQRAAQTTVIREVGNQFEKWKNKGMHPDRTRNLNYWSHLKAELIDWIFRIARVPGSPRSTVIAQHLAWQFVSQLWGREMAGRYSEEVAETFSRGAALLPVPFLCPSAVEERAPPGGLPPPRLRPYMLTAFVQDGRLTIQEDTLLEQFPIVIASGTQNQTIPLQGLERRELAPPLFPFGDVDMRIYQPSGSTPPPGPSDTLAERMEVDEPLVIRPTTSSEQDQAAARRGSPPPPVPTPAPRDIVFSRSGGQSPRMVPELKGVLVAVFQKAQKLGGPWAGQWTGHPHIRPASTVRVRRQVLLMLEQIEGPLTPFEHWHRPKYYQRPLWQRLQTLIHVAESQDVDVTEIDIAGVVEAMIDAGELSPSQHALLIETWIWKYGTSLLHFPVLLEQYILGPIRRAHPSIHVPRLPWLYWRTNPAIPRSVRFSLRAWFVHHFGPPSLGVQTQFTEGQFYVTDADRDAHVGGPATSVFWSEHQDYSMQYVESWVSLYNRIQAFLDVGGNPNMEEVSLEVTGDATTPLRLFAHGYAPMPESGGSPATFQVSPLRCRDSHLTEILRDNLGLHMPETLVTRERKGGHFPTRGDYESSLGREERPARPARDPNDASRGIAQEWNIDPFHLLSPPAATTTTETREEAQQPTSQPSERPEPVTSSSLAPSADDVRQVVWGRSWDNVRVVTSGTSEGASLTVTVPQSASTVTALLDEEEVIALDYDEDEDEDRYEDDDDDAPEFLFTGFDDDRWESRR